MNALGPSMQPSQLKSLIVDVPDFPTPGILFRDVMPLVRDHLASTLAALDALLPAGVWGDIDYVAGIESRGFILASALAAKHGKGFVPVRKQGKLPPPVVDHPYALEYGTGTLEMQLGQGRVLLVDDVLATGGTLSGAAELCERAGYEVRDLLVLVDIGIAPGFAWRKIVPKSVLSYQP
jgi:adenine phosphoribosyltransferase